jgi:hypothetical protein
MISSRVTRELLTWNSGSLGLALDTIPEGGGNGGVYFTSGRQTNVVGSWQDRVNLAAGCSAEWFNMGYQQPEDYLSEDTQNFTSGIGGWYPLTGGGATLSTTWNVGGRKAIGLITFPAGGATAGSSGASLQLDGLERGQVYSFFLDTVINNTPSDGVSLTVDAAASFAPPGYSTSMTGQTYTTIARSFIADRDTHTVSVRNLIATPVGAMNAALDNVRFYNGVGNTGTRVYQAIKDPVMRAWAGLVKPQDFWAPADTPTHVYFSGGMAPGFGMGQNAVSPTGTKAARVSPRRLDDAYRGVSYVDDSALPMTTSDLLSPRAERKAGLQNIPYRQPGSAFHSTLYTLPPAAGGVVYRGNYPRNPIMALPWYIGGFFKTTHSVWDFFGSYINYLVAAVAFAPGVTDLRVLYSNDTLTTAGTIGYLAITYNTFGSDVGFTQCLTVPVNDGKWHHWFIWVNASGIPTLYVDGIGTATPSSGGPATAVNTTGAVAIGQNFFSGFDGDQGFNAMGDATNVTVERIKYLASMRTLPDYTMSINGSNSLATADNGTFHYDPATATWTEPLGRFSAWDGSKWSIQPKVRDNIPGSWRRP